MLEDAGNSPFCPGFGIPPQYLAGRKRETLELSEALKSAKAAATRGKDHDVVLYPPLGLVGPRGIGKSSLLHWSVDKAKSMGFQTVRTYPDLLDDPGVTLLSICPQGRLKDLKKTAGRLGHKFSLSRGVLDIGESLDVQSYMILVSEAIRERARLGPLLIVMDDAQSTGDLPLKCFITAVGDLVSRERLPVAMFIAGTPKLREKFRKNSLFIAGRVFLLEFNLLLGGEASEGLEETFATRNVKVQRQALAMMAEFSDDHPFFLQIIGHSAWYAAAERGEPTITSSIVRQGIGYATKRRTAFFCDRRTELMEEFIYGHAVEVVKIVNEQGGVVHDEILAEELAARMPAPPKMGRKKGPDAPRHADDRKDVAYRLERRLIELGFLCRKGTMLCPGIPSLFDYIETETRVVHANQIA